jgi:hypothetical protein
MAEAPADAASAGSGGGGGLFGIAGEIGKAFFGTAGAIYGGKAQQNMYNYQAQVARQEAEIARQKANRDIMAGEVRAQRSGLISAAAISRQNVREGAGNVSMTGPSATGVRMSQVAEGQEAQRIDRTNAAEMAYGEQVKAAGYEATAGMAETAAKTAKGAMWINIGSSIVGGAAGVADKWQAASLYGGGPSSIQDESNPYTG